MRLLSCVQGLEYKIIKGDTNGEVKGVAFDSREVKSGFIFVAVEGFKVDGHDFIQKAIENGATTIVISKDIDLEFIKAQTVVKVSDSRVALAYISARFYENPTEKMNLIGITGTNGKTSISYFVKSILDSLSEKTGVIGTMGTWIGAQKIDTPNTTPESLTVQKICADMVNEDVKYCIMEVSSHALDLHRVSFCQFQSGIFTNLTPDHLELHKDMAQYFHAKEKLFYMTEKVNVINIDDPYGRKLYEDLCMKRDVECLSYGLKEDADVHAKDIEHFADYSLYKAVTPNGDISIRVNIPGEIYIYNTLAVVAWAISENIDFKVIAKGIDALKGVKGRFETVYQDEDNKVVVDFAHTEDGLEKALDTLRPFVKGRLLLVFGVYAAPGLIGLDKRVAMGKVAAEKSDFAYITSDNPKEQDPQKIIDDVVASFEKYSRQFTTIVDRKVAIEHALESMVPGDVLLIAGKGHETSQVVGKEEIPFNEAEIVKNKMKLIRREV